MRVGQKQSTTTKAKAKAKVQPVKIAKWKPALAKDPHDAFDRASINLVAIPGGGKTGAALSISKAWDPTKFGMGKPLVFDDIIHVGFDETALVGFTAIGCKFPYHFDVRQVMVENNWGLIDALKAIRAEAYEICEKVGGIVGYIDDTISMLCFFLEAELAQAGYESPQLYLHMKKEFQAYRMELIALPESPRLIGCFHLTEPSIDIPNARDPKAKDKKKAKEYTIAGEGGSLLTAVATRSIKNYFFGAGSLEIFCRSYKSPRGDWVYEMRLEDYNNVRTKNRFRMFDGANGIWKGSLRDLLIHLKGK